MELVGPYGLEEPRVSRDAAFAAPAATWAEEWDARAFLWWEPRQLAVVPISDWNSSGALALRVKTDTRSAEIEHIARITHETRGFRSREILRSIVIRDDLWTLSGNYLQANDLDTLDRRAWLDIPVG